MPASVLIALASIAALVPASGCATAAPCGAVQGPPPGQSQVQVVLEGYVEVLIEDSTPDTRTLYFLISEDDRISLRFLVDPPNLTTGTRIRVGGEYEPDGTFVVSRVERLSER
jgi:hypothetical protein